VVKNSKNNFDKRAKTLQEECTDLGRYKTAFLLTILDNTVLSLATLDNTALSLETFFFYLTKFQHYMH
jgi:hypothetical protein